VGKKKQPATNRGSRLLSDYLTREKLTVSAFATTVASTKSYISMLRLGRVTPGLRLAARIQDKTGIPCDAWLEAA
jgi:plasmid maintenance system antidote protein VapI